MKHFQKIISAFFISFVCALLVYFARGNNGTTDLMVIASGILKLTGQVFGFVLVLYLLSVIVKKIRGGN